MKKQYNAALKKKLAEVMREKLPQFVEVTKKSYFYFNTERVYEAEIDGVRCFIIVIPDHKGRNEFTVELGWSLLGRLPELPGRPSGAPRENHAEFENKEFVFRMNRLISGTDDWWVVRRPGIQNMPNPFGYPLTIVEDIQPISTKEAEMVIEPLVRDCVDKVIQYGLPYFKNLANYWREHKS